MNQGDLKSPRKKSLMILANGGVQDRGYERKMQGGNQWDFQICPSNDCSMFSGQTEARNGGIIFSTCLLYLRFMAAVLYLTLKS